MKRKPWSELTRAEKQAIIKRRDGRLRNRISPVNLKRLELIKQQLEQ